jgi:hypothetical protein
MELFLCIIETIIIIHRESCVHLNLTPKAFIQTVAERKWKLMDIERIQKCASEVDVYDAGEGEDGFMMGEPGIPNWCYLILFME